MCLQWKVHQGCIIRSILLLFTAFLVTVLEILTNEKCTPELHHAKVYFQMN